MSNKKIIIISVVLGFVISLTYGFINYNKNIESGLCDKILRFHVIANSDSSTDQIIKIAVKKSVLEEINNITENYQNKDEVKEIIEENKHIILKTASDTIKRFDKNYGVKVDILEKEFPEKSLYDYTFPKGRYETVNITLGNGNGRNFFGLIYPNSCINDSTVKVELDNELKNILSEDEYNIINYKNSDKAVFEVRFKLYDLYQSF